MKLPFFGKSKTKTSKHVIPIQGGVLGIEGGHPQLDPQSLLFWQVDQGAVPGTINAYTTYDAQVAETYRKYNGLAAYGAPQCRLIVDLRTAFIAGEGINVECKNPATSAWIDDFLESTKLNGSAFIDAVKASETAGQLLLLLKPVPNKAGEIEIKFGKRVYTDGTKFRIRYVDAQFPDEIDTVELYKNGTWVPLDDLSFVYVRTGGDDCNTSGPTTKVGLVLNELENYDRAIKDIRRNNYVSARATPVFSTETQQGADALTDKLKKESWTIGKAFVGAKVTLQYVSPTTGASENLLKEIEASVKTISGTTGIPVHWMGYVDLMSNRNTADSLYELVKNQTINERSVWEPALKALILNAMELYIDNGGTDLTYDENFTVTLPLLDMAGFKDRIAAYSMALGDEIISRADYRNLFPGINPIETQRAIEQEKAEQAQKMSSVNSADKLNKAMDNMAQGVEQ